jgi:hypothetical protein
MAEKIFHHEERKIEAAHEVHRSDSSGRDNTNYLKNQSKFQIGVRQTVSLPGVKKWIAFNDPAASPAAN